MSNTLDRFMDKFVMQPNGCWGWIASLANGYGSFHTTGSHRAHRYSYELFFGAVPAELQLDHLCRNRACVNPYHLEPVTHRENTLRGIGVTAQNAKKTRCDRGHELNAETIYWRKDGRGRECRMCHTRWRKIRQGSWHEVLGTSGREGGAK